MIDENNLTPEEERLVDLLFEVEDDEEFVNDVMEVAYQLELIEEMADYIEKTQNCNREDVYRHMFSFVKITIED